MSTVNAPANTTAIREILTQHARLGIDLATIEDTFDLHACGLTSLATVSVMLALEDRFDIEFPESMLGRETFRSIANIQDAVDALLS